MSRPLPLSRTTSFSSEGDDVASMSSSNITVSSSRRTRKRFTNTQLTMLEHLFHQNSHPSRDDREAVAKAGGMEIKSVTIWFQNKRQTERKSAAISNTSHSSHPPTMYTFSLNGMSRTVSPSLSATSKCTSNSSRPSLDCVASRSELRVAAPRTPSRLHNSSGAIWENMPSSPPTPPISPPPREFIDFGKNTRTRRTLEWACAAARVAEKDGHSSDINWDRGDLRRTPVGGVASNSRKGVDDDDMFKAALALCGLGRQT